MLITIKNKLLLLLILLLGILNPVSRLDGVIGWALFAFSLLIVFKKIKPKPWLIITPLLFGFILTSYLNSAQLREFLAVNSQPKMYMHDMGLYLKTYYLMKENGLKYYAAHQQAFVNHMVFQKPPTDVWGWRLPTIFYLWSVIPITNGIIIWWLFVGLCLLGLTAVFAINRLLLPREKSHLAILAPYLLFPYLHFAARDWTMLQLEWWAVILLLLGLYFYFRKQVFKAILFLSLALVSRELLLIPLLLMASLTLVFKRKDLKYFLIPCLVFGLFLIGHTLKISQIVALQPGLTKYSPTFHRQGKQLLLTTLAFGSWEYLFYQLRIFTLMFGLAIIGFFKKISFSKAIIASGYLLPLSYLLIGTSELNQVWGVLFMPFVFLAIPWLVVQD